MNAMEAYISAEAYIMSQLPMYQRVGAAAYKANLDNTIQWLNYLGNPQNQFRSIHIAGTNGKGSVSHFLTSIFQEAGYKTGLYTSPHLTDYRERIRINGTMIDKAYVVRFIEKHRAFLDQIKPSFFEMSVGLCFMYFADRQVDVAVIETGMGGRLDSTNLLHPDMCVITNIGHDHMKFLGNSLAEISVEKAGIIKPSVPVVIGETHPETKPVFAAAAKKNKSKISFADRMVNTTTETHALIPPKLEVRMSVFNKSYLLHSPLAGLYQIKNIQTVLVTSLRLRESGYKIYIRHIRNGIRNVIKNTSLSGRWLVTGSKPPMIMDTAHNAEGLKYVTTMLKSLSYSALHMVIGMVDDKDHESLLKLLPRNATYYFCTPSVPRGFDAGKLLKKASKCGLKGSAWPNTESAMAQALQKAGKKDVIFVGGSTFTVADALGSGLTNGQQEKTINTGKQLKLIL